MKFAKVVRRLFTGKNKTKNSEAQSGQLNLSKAVRLFIRCLFHDDELLVGSIKEMDKKKIELLFDEVTKWYSCTLTDVRQVMSFRLSEIRKTKGAKLLNFNLQ